MVIWVNPIWAWINWGWGTGLWASIRTWVIAWEELSKASQEKKVKDYFDNRQKVNNDIATWKIKSWNPWQDTIAVRKTNLVNMFAADALEKWANPDKVMAITKKPDEVLKRLTSLWEQQANAVNEYLMNGGYADRVFDYVMGKSKNPYTKVDENASNFLGWLKSVPEQTIGTALDLANKGYSKAGLTKDAEEQNKKSYEQYNQLTSSLNTDEYNAYKEWKAKWDNIFNKMFDTGLHKKYENFNEQGQSFVNGWLIDKAWMYDAYDEAVKEWFSGSVEDYARYMDNMAAQVSGGISDAVKREIENTYDTESWAFKAGKVVWDIAEFMATPELKVVKWTKYIPVLWKFLEKWWEKMLEKYPKATKRLSELDKWIEWGVKFQALEDAYNNELSSAEKYLTTAAMNAAIWWALNWIWTLLWKSRPINAWLKRLGSPNKAAQKSVWTKTLKERDEMSKISKAAAEDYNAEITPRTKILEKLEEAKKFLIDKRIIKWQKLEEIEWKIKFDRWKWLKYDANDMLKEIENWFKELWKKKKWGKNAKYPEFFKDWKTFLDDETKKVLNSFTRDEWDKVIRLWDEMETLRNDIFVNTDRAMDATTSQEFYKWLKSLLKDKWWTKRWQWTKVFREAFDTIKWKFTNSLSKPSQKALAKAEAESAESIRISNLFDDMVWRLENKPVWVSAAQWAEKAVQWDEATRELFKLIKKYTKSEKYPDGIDMNNEIWAWVTNMAIYNPEYARQLAATIYPSMPWMYEFIIKNALWWLKKKVARTYTKDYETAGAWGTMNNAIQQLHKWEQSIANAAAPIAWWLYEINKDD